MERNELHAELRAVVDDVEKRLCALPHPRHLDDQSFRYVVAAAVDGVRSELVRLATRLEPR